MKALKDIIKKTNETKNDQELGRYIRDYFVSQEISTDQVKFYPQTGIWYNTKTKEAGAMRGMLDI